MKTNRISTIFFLTILCLLFVSAPVLAEQTVTAVKVTSAPVLDGVGNDKVWDSAQTTLVKDIRLDKVVKMKALSTDDMVFFLIEYPDEKENRLHKPWVWDKEAGVYRMGKEREDTFYFKWNMEDREVDLSNFSDDDYVADIWYWKAHRTDPAGYADDKFHVFSSTTGKKAKEIMSKGGKKRYLVRNGDEGKAAQKKVFATTYKGDVLESYKTVIPEGSRADVRAKGLWKDGTWTIEFGRKLHTGNKDDAQLSRDPGKKHQFGVSILSLYGEPVDNTKFSFYGQGRISETLYLVFQ